MEKYIPIQIPINLQALPIGVKVERETFEHLGKKYVLIDALGSSQVPDGEYLYDPDSKRIELQWAQGIGSAPRRA